MARNGSGSFSLVAGNPVTTGTQITATWANNTLSDIASEITGSVASDGQTTITGPIKFSSGSVSAPAMTFSSETNTGFYRSGAGVVSMAIAGSQKYIFGATSVTLAGTAVTAEGLAWLGGTATSANVTTLGAQPIDTTLTALAGTLTAANKIPYATALDTASELTFNPSTALAAGTTTVPSQTVVKTAVDDLVINCTTATPDLSADYFVFEDATDNTQKKALLNTISLFSTSYTSPTPSALSTGVIAENHGLGANPSLVQASFRCATAEAGYSIGDEIKVAGYDAPSVEAIATWANATQVGYTSSGTTIRVPNKSTGALTTLTLANWTVVLRAWK